MDTRLKPLPLLLSFGLSGLMHAVALALVIATWSMHAPWAASGAPASDVARANELDRRSADRSRFDRLFVSDDQTLKPSGPDADDPQPAAPDERRTPADRATAGPTAAASPSAAPLPPRRPAQAKTQEVRLGSDRGSKVVRLAWIGYDDFRKLQGLPGQVAQPALQMKADPLPGAPMVLDPTPPAPAPGGGGGRPAPPRASVPRAAVVVPLDRPDPQAGAAANPALILPPSPARPMPAPTPGPTPAPPPQVPGQAPAARVAQATPMPAPSPPPVAASPAAPAPTPIGRAGAPGVIPAASASDHAGGLPVPAPVAPRPGSVAKPPTPTPTPSPAASLPQPTTPALPSKAVPPTPATPPKPVPTTPQPTAGPQLAMVTPAINPAAAAAAKPSSTAAAPTTAPSADAPPSAADSSPTMPPPPAPSPAVGGPLALASPAVRSSGPSGDAGSPLLPPGTAGAPSNPTGAPRADRESSPVSLTPTRPAVISPGGVLAGEGIEIKTVAPRFSVVAQSTSLPGNTEARIIFSKDGQVIDVHIIKSSGYPNIDGPILSSLYQWRASGRMLAQLNSVFQIDVIVVLSRGS